MAAAPDINLLNILSDYSRLFTKISSYTGNLYRFKLPRIVVIGDQSSGKSSTLVVICLFMYPA